MSAQQSLERLAESNDGQPGNSFKVIAVLEDVSPESGTHSRRVAARAYRLGKRLGGLDDGQLATLRFAGLVHDIGKLGVPERILHKPARLEDREAVIMNTHPAIGAELGRYEQFSDAVIEVILYHHERWDGTGYPARLVGERIPLFARIVAIADAYDTMISRRSYQNPRDVEYAVGEIVRCAGTQFDPRLAKVFVEMKCDRHTFLRARFAEYLAA
jgi:putative nucleotidyltransferase with HDIG domain